MRELDIRYARSVSQLQLSLIGGLLRLANIHLAHLGMNPDDIDLDIKLTSVSSIDKEARLEQKRVSVETASVLWDMITKMNDKLSGDSGNPNPFDLSEEGGDNKTPLDLDYVADHILTKYFELDQLEVNKILRKEDVRESEEESRRRIHEGRRRKYPNSDLKETYPLRDNISKFNSIKESLKVGSKDIDRLDTKTFSGKEGISYE